MIVLPQSAYSLKPGFFGVHNKLSTELSILLHSADEKIEICGPDEFRVSIKSEPDRGRLGPKMSGAELLKVLGTQNQDKTLTVNFLTTPEDYCRPGLPKDRLARYYRNFNAAEPTISKLGFRRVIWFANPVMVTYWYLLCDTAEPEASCRTWSEEEYVDETLSHLKWR